MSSSVSPYCAVDKSPVTEKCVTYRAVLVSALGNVVGFNNGGKDREAMACVQGRIKVILIDACQLDFIARLGKDDDGIDKHIIL